MPNSLHQSPSRCDGATRRDVLTIGALTAFGLGLPQLFHPRRAFAAPEKRSSDSPRAKSCILIWLDGGPSHLETFDPKPNAPKEVRGPLSTISTALPGVAVADVLPKTAAMLDRMALVRSVTSPLGEHNFGAHYLLTGYKPTPALEYPAFGSVLAHVRGGRGVLPANVAVPDFRVGGGKLGGNGYLPPSTQPFSIGGDPSKPGFKVKDLDLAAGLNLNRLDRRRDFVNALDRLSRTIDNAGPNKSDPVPIDPQFEQAYRLITSESARRAFNLEEEPAAVRTRYGGRTIGQSCLLARRLVERGVPFVTVNDRGWDTHNDLYTRLKEGYTGAKVPVGLAPSLDLALTGLVSDLDDRGLLEETLVLVMGEFGRTPKLNTQGGRDHWPRVFSVLLAGGGVQPGVVVGSSDAVGEGPKDDPVTPSDLAATIYTLLGVDPEKELRTTDGRPVRINADGEVVRGLIS